MGWMGKEDAAREMKMSLSTLNRRIERDEVDTRREGRRVYVWVELPETHADTSGETHDASNEIHGVSSEIPGDMSEMALKVAVLEERCRNAEELADYRGELLVEADARAQMLIALLRETQEANTNLTASLAQAQQANADIIRALPPAPAEPPFPGTRRRGLLGWLRRR